MLQTHSLAERIDERMRAGKVALPVFDDTAMRVYEAVRKDRMSAAELATLIEADPVLASEVLRSANSSFFRGLGDVSRVRDAIVRLGGRNIAGLAVAASQKRVYSASSQRFKTRMVDLWRHASATGYGCRWLAHRLGLREREDEAFLAGLLHDVGKLSILRAIEELASEEGAEAQLSEAVIDVALEQLHPQHGSELLANWNIPRLFRDIAAQHHEPEFDRDDTTLVIVRLVNAACHQEGIGGMGGGAGAETSDEAHCLGLGEIQLAELQVVLEDAAAAA